FDRLRHFRRTRIDDLFAEILRAAFPLQIFGTVHAGLREQLVDEFAIGALQSPHKGALLLPALPNDGFFGPAVMAGSGGLLKRRRIALSQCVSPSNDGSGGALASAAAKFSRPTGCLGVSSLRAAPTA